MPDLRRTVLQSRYCKGDGKASTLKEKTSKNDSSSFEKADSSLIYIESLPFHLKNTLSRFRLQERLASTNRSEFEDMIVEALEELPRSLREKMANVEIVLHEIGYHFGLKEEDLKNLG